MSSTQRSSAKAGLLGLTRSLARELGPDGICVNTVLPGAIQVDTQDVSNDRYGTAPRGRRCPQDRIPHVIHSKPVRDA